MTELSPAAKIVLDAFLGDAENTGLQMDDLRENVAAALRAAADQLKYKLLDVEVVDCSQLRLLAEELETQ